MKWHHVVKVEGDEALLCACAEGCECTVDPDDPTKCSCGHTLERVDLKGTGIYFCNCGGSCMCNTVSDRPGAIDSQQTVAGGPQAYWTWDATRRFSTFAFAGLTAVVEAPEFLRGVILPTGGATINFTDGDRGQAALSWVHGVSANIFTSDVTVNNRYTLRGNIPMPFVEDRASLNASVAYRRGRFLDIAAGEQRGRTEQVIASLGANYAIDEAWGLALRYRNTRQVRDDLLGERVGIARQTVTLSLGGRFPTEIAAQVPAESVRVDEQNAALEGGDSGGF